MIVRPLYLMIACGSLLLAAGCQGPVGGRCHKPQAYAAAGDLPALRVPADLDGPDTSAALEVPALTEPELPLDPDGPCLEAPPALTAPPLPPSAESILEEGEARRGRRARPGDEALPEGEEEQPRRRRPRPPR